MAFTATSDVDKPLVDLEEEKLSDDKLSKTKFKVSDRPNLNDKKPQTERTTRPTNAKTTSTPYKAGAIAAGMEDIYGSGAMLWSMFDSTCGTALLQCAPSAAQAWEELAKNDPKIRVMLMRIFTGSSWGKVFQAHLPLLIAVFMHHGMGRVHQEFAQTEKPMPDPFPQYEGFQTDLFAQESPGFGVPTGGVSPTSVPNNGHGYTYQMPENPAAMAG